MRKSMCTECTPDSTKWCVHCGGNYLNRPKPGVDGKTKADFKREVRILVGLETTMSPGQIVDRLNEISEDRYECIASCVVKIESVDAVSATT